jgi:peptide/nickel transport system substrate-binding protein
VKKLADAGMQIIKTPDKYMVAMYYLPMKNTVKPFDNKKVRQAINWAIDRNALLQITFGYGWLKSNAVAAGSWAFNPKAISYDKRDLEKAKQLMKEAGYEPGKPAFTTSLKLWKERPENLQIAQVVQANLADIGITVNLQVLEIGQWVDTVNSKHDFEMALTSLVPRWDPNDQLGNAYVTDDGSALEWKNAEFLAAWEGGAASPDIEKRKPFYDKAQEIAMEEAPCAILNGAPRFHATAKNIRDVIRYNRNDIWYERIWIQP